MHKDKRLYAKRSQTEWASHSQNSFYKPNFLPSAGNELFFLCSLRINCRYKTEVCFDRRKESCSLKIFSKVLTTALLTMGIILTGKDFYPTESLKDLTESVRTDTEIRLQYELKPGVNVKCPYCQKPLVHCGYHTRKLSSLSGMSLIVTLQRMKCCNPQCAAVRKNHCGRSTHVIYPFFIIHHVRWHVAEKILFVF